MRKIDTYQKSVFLKSEHWNEIKLSGEYASNRTNSTLITYKNRIYLFGGDEIEGNTKDDDFIYFEFDDQTYGNDSLKWKKVDMVNPQDGPGNLERHTSNLVGQKLYIFGGKQSLFKSSDILYVFDLQTGIWEQLPSEGQVPCLDSHSTCVYKFSDEDQQKFYNDQKQIQQQQNQQNQKDGENQQQNQQQQPELINLDVELIVYGGFNITGYQSQLYSYNIHNKKWQNIVPSSNNNIPKNRSNHSACIVKDCMYMFGGTNGHERFNDFFMFDLNNKIWTQIQTENSPCGRSGHSMNKYNNQLIIFGGLKSLMNELNDLHTYNIDSKQWKVLENFSDYTTQNPDSIDNHSTHNLETSQCKKSQKHIKAQAYLNINRPNHSKYQRYGSISRKQSMSSTQETKMFDNNSQNTQNIRENKSSFVSKTHRRYPSQNSQSSIVASQANLKQSQILAKETKDFSLVRDSTLNNFQLQKYFGQPKTKKNLGLNTLYGNLRKIKISPLLNQEQKKDKLKDTQKKIMLKEFEEIKIEEGEENPIVQSMRNAITGVQKKTTKDAVQVILNDQRTVMKMTNIVNDVKNRIFSKKPMPRDGHSTCIINDKLILFGGDRHRLTFNDTYELDLKSVLHSQFKNM